jgi:hypothetical protein
VPAFSAATPREDTPLLEREALSKTDSQSKSRVWLAAKYGAGFLFVISAGVIAWWISGPEKAKYEAPGYNVSREWEIQALGWSSAVLFRGFRLPAMLSATVSDGLVFSSGITNSTDPRVPR